MGSLGTMRRIEQKQIQGVKEEAWVTGLGTAIAGIRKEWSRLGEEEWDVTCECVLRWILLDIQWWYEMDRRMGREISQSHLRVKRWCVRLYVWRLGRQISGEAWRPESGSTHLHRNWVGLGDFEQIVLTTAHMVYLLSRWFRIDFYIDLAKNSVVWPTSLQVVYSLWWSRQFLRNHPSAVCSTVNTSWSTQTILVKSAP